MTPRSIAICGSCPTRDVFNSRFNPEFPRWYSLDLSNFQSSMLALMSPPVDADEALASEDLSDHAAGTIRSDMDSSFLEALAELRPDYLLVDFSGDVGFGAIRLPDGRYLTDNPYYLQRTGYYERLLAAGGERLGWQFDADEYRALWIESMDRFVAFVAEHCPETKVILHRYRSVNAVVLHDVDRPRDLRRWARLKPLEVRRINHFRFSLDDLAVSRYGWDVIDLRAERYTSHADHPWGPHYVHYTLDYHPRFLAELHHRDLAERVDPDASARIALIASSSQKRLRDQANFVHDADQAQAARLLELETRGPLRAGREALGRRRRAGAAKMDA